MFILYRCTVAILFYCSLPLLLIFIMITGKHRRGLLERFGFYPQFDHGKDAVKTVWLHAASVGEVQAARHIVAQLQKQLPNVRIILTTMTLHGKRVAINQLPGSVTCVLAPLDVPWITGRACNAIKPDIYICIETELWPILLDLLARRKVRLCLVNGRISRRSCRRYKRMGWLIRQTLNNFDKMAVISPKDRSRFLELGARKSCLAVEGNVKYDLSLPENAGEIRKRYKKLFCINGENVLVAGSTHTGEEEEIIKLHNRLAEDCRLMTIIAPRHVERVEEIENELQSRALSYQLFSTLKTGKERRQHRIVLVDTMGELASLYSIADYVFCGGSLVNKGGHNLMEAAIWNKVVFWGPFIDDFHDAAELLASVNGGYLVVDIADMEERIRSFLRNRDQYHLACQQAGTIASAQQGSSLRQVSFLLGKESL